MAHFAQLNSENIVTLVLVVPDEQEHRGQEFLANDLGLGGVWLQTSYNNRIRKQFAGVGFKYDKDKDIFIAPQPASWYVLDENNDWFCPEGINPFTGKPLTDDELLIKELSQRVSSGLDISGVPA